MAIKRKRSELGEPESLNDGHQQLNSGNHVSSPTKRLRSPNKHSETSRSRRKLNNGLEVEETVLRTPKQKGHRQLSNETITTRNGQGRDESPSKEGALEINKELRTPKQGKVVVEIAISRSSKHTTSIHTPDPPASKFAASDSPSHSAQLLVSQTKHNEDSSQQLSSCLNAQKREILRILRTSPLDAMDISSTEGMAHKQLSELIQGSVMRGEGNSCLVLGPRGSGKSRILERSLDNLTDKPIILRLSGWSQNTDKQALREIATQLLLQTGTSLLMDSDAKLPSADEDENPFIDPPDAAHQISADPLRIPPSSQLHVLIPMLLTLARPVIVVLDAFDMFALHPRQSLLYCLFDAVQSCRATPKNRGIAVIGMTSRIDTINLLEKRVKSRFSGRVFRTGPPNDIQHWLGIARSALLVPITHKNQKVVEEWNRNWTTSVDEFLSDPKVMKLFNETFDISRDVQVLHRLLTHSVLCLDTNEPCLTYKSLTASVDSQRVRERCSYMNNLSYPMICLLIAGIHSAAAGHPVFTFEMLFEKFREQLRSSTSAPVQWNGGHIGMVKCTRDVLMTAFDSLVSVKIFISTVAPSVNLAMESIKHQSAVDREVLQKIVERSGHIHLKKWLNKG